MNQQKIGAFLRTLRTVSDIGAVTVLSAVGLLIAVPELRPVLLKI